LELAVLAATTVASIAEESIAAAFTEVQPCAAAWRSASELLQWERLPPELMELMVADTIPIGRATELLQDRANTASGRLFLLRLGAI
jgi:hypothetical protein